MAANFDFQRMYTRFDLRNPARAVAFQSVVRDFMEVVRNDEAGLVGKQQDIDRFCSLVSTEASWPLAQAVVPEFQLPQNVPTDEHTALHLILRTVHHLRPGVPMVDESLTHEKILLRRRIRESTLYIWGITHGTGNMSAEERRAIAEDIVRMERLLIP